MSKFVLDNGSFKDSLEIVYNAILDSIEVSIPACHAGDPGSIPGRGDQFFYKIL